MRVAVLDMQPIEPAVGGGRLRLLGLYHALGENMETHYVGTYDWPGPQHRRQMLSPTLEELLVPLSAEHFSAAEARAREAGGRNVIDTTFPELARLSPDYVAAAHKAAETADIVVFSHPWTYPLMRDRLDRRRQLVVYDAHNVEGILRMELLDDGAAGTAIVRNVVQVERELCERADLVLACSQEDRVAFHRLYGIPFARMRVFPNGTFTSKIAPATAEEKAAARKSLEIGSSKVAFFIGSNYAPNAEAARYIVEVLAPALPHVQFAIAGGVADALAGLRRASNLRIPGLVYEDARLQWLHAADIGINPMFSGSGTNIKMLDYLAAGLPIVTTAIGARGLDLPSPPLFRAEPIQFASQLSEIANDCDHIARKLRIRSKNVLANFSWEALSPRLGAVLAAHFRNLGHRPFFSVVIPLDRDNSADAALHGLSGQVFRDFEIISVGNGDRGEHRPGGSGPTPVPVSVPPGLETETRRLGAEVSSGQVIAFLEPDSAPDSHWLENAHNQFRGSNIAVLQGGMRDNTSPVSTIARWGENTFIRSNIFHSLGSNNQQFSVEDLAWHAQACGLVAGSTELRVHKYSSSRNSENDQVGWPQKIGWISTWNVPCGIAEYSRNLLRGLGVIRNGGAPTLIFCDSRTSAGTEANNIVVPSWVLGASDVRHLVDALLREPLQALVVQHHPGLLPWRALRQLMNDDRLSRLEISVMLHNTQELNSMEPAAQSAAVAALRRAGRVFVHTTSDFGRLTQVGLRDSTRVIPHGAPEMRIVRPARRLDSSSSPIVGCFGFFFPHKRIHALIEAFAKIREIWPNARLRLVNAAFPRDDSRQEIARCRRLAADLRIIEAIEWITEFVDESVAIDLLSQCDLIMLPYSSTAESASGAVRIALASGTPVAATSVAIFDEAEGVVARLEDPSPSGLARSIHEILGDLDYRLALQRAADGWTQIRSWDRIAARLMQEIASEVKRGHHPTVAPTIEIGHAQEMLDDTLASADHHSGLLHPQRHA